MGEKEIKGKKLSRKNGKNEKKKIHGEVNSVVRKVDDLEVVSHVSDRSRCKICNDSRLRFFVADKMMQGVSKYKLKHEIREKFGIGIADRTIEEHLNEHEVMPVWLGFVKAKFPTEEDRKKYEEAFLSRVSVVTELWDKYLVLAELFKMIVGEPGNVNVNFDNPRSVGAKVDYAIRLGNEMRGYLEDMLKLQKERDIVMEVGKVVLYLMGDRLIQRLGAVISDLSVERKRIIGDIIVEEIKNALGYVKGLAHEKVENLIQKVKQEYEKLCSIVDSEM